MAQSITNFIGFHTAVATLAHENSYQLMMNSTLFFQTLAAFTNEELEELHRFLRSPVHNASKLANKCTELYQFCRASGFRGPVTYEAAFGAIYPGKPFNQHLLNNVMSALLDVAREYIGWRKWRQQQGGAVLWLEMARFYRERGLDHRFVQALEKGRKELVANSSGDSADYFLHHFLLEKEAYGHLSVLNTLDNGLNLPSLTNSYLKFHLAQGLEIGLRYLHQLVLTTIVAPEAQQFADALRAQAREVGYLGEPSIELLDLAFPLVLGHASEEAFELFLGKLKEFGNRLSPELHKLLATIGRMFVTSLINKGKASYKQVLFQLFKGHLAAGLLYENDKIPQSTLLNLVISAIESGEDEWAGTLLEDHRHAIAGSESPEVAYQFIKAYLLFRTKAFGEAAQRLDLAFAELNKEESRSHTRDFILKLMARKLEIQLLYETSPSSSLLADRLNACKMFLHRNKYISKSHKNLYNNFVDLMKQLVLPSTQTDPQKAKKLLEKLSKPGFLIADRRWVTEKVRSLAGER